MRGLRTPCALLPFALLWASAGHAGEFVPNPYAPTGAPAVLDLSRPTSTARPPHAAKPSPRFEDLDRYRDVPETDLPQGQLPDGWVQHGSMVVPRAIAEGAEPRANLSPGLNPSRDNIDGPGVEELCTFPEGVQSGVYDGIYLRGTEYPRHGTIYMNYTGGLLFNGKGENSAENQSTLARSGHEFPVYGGGEERAIAVAQAVQADYAEMAVRVVYLERPNKRLPYAMIMMGGSYKDTSTGPSGGVAPSADCEDHGLRNVCYAFVRTQGISTQANIASQELGHTMGLGHTYGSDRVMAFGYDTNSPIDMGFGDDCATVLTAAGQGGYCSGINTCHCGGDGKAQHDLRTLKAIYAPPAPDMIPPTISITSPEDGASFPEGEPIIVKVDPWDNFGGYGWDITIAQGDTILGESVDYELSQQFVIIGLKPGTYTFTTRVQDHEDQIGEDAITVTVEGAPGETDAPTTSESDTGDTGSASDASSGADTESGEAAGQDSDGSAEDGCSCRDGERPSSLALLLAPLLLFMRRRRRA
ncbi:MAG: hypothetical protein H0T76_02710 [Nannocystis sp.]|nr:hypothetical protein [Nannocystis sp.]MBA3545372.1 hypothetical protein [Nannocystis sp.]